MRIIRVVLAACSGILIVYLVLLLVVPSWLKRQHPEIDFRARPRTLSRFTPEGIEGWTERKSKGFRLVLPVHWIEHPSGETPTYSGDGFHLILSKPNRINHEHYKHILERPWDLIAVLKRPIVLHEGAMYAQQLGIWRAYIFAADRRWTFDLFQDGAHVLATFRSGKPISDSDEHLMRSIISGIRILGM